MSNNTDRTDMGKYAQFFNSDAFKEERGIILEIEEDKTCKCLDNNFLYCLIRN